MIRLITFDLDDTFWEIAPVIRRADERMMDWLGQHAPQLAEPYSRRGSCGMRNQLINEFPQRSHDLTFLWKETMRRMAAEQRLDPAIAEPAFEIYYAARNDVILYEDVLPVLDRLHGQYLLGVLSNGNASVSRVGIDHWFDFALSAEQVGAAKPHQSMFQEACRVVDVAPDQVAHVGDHPEHDVLGALQAGMRAVWVNRGGEVWCESEFKPHAEVSDLNELEQVIGAL